LYKKLLSDSKYPYLSRGKWQHEARPRGDEFFRKRIMALIEGFQAPEDNDILIERGEVFIRKTAD
jgi:hypothetical protein